MWPYVMLVAVPLLKSRMRYRVGLRYAQLRNRTVMGLFWWMILVLLVLRHETVGIDLAAYRYIFQTIADSSWKEAIGRSPEVGYNFLYKFLSVLTDDFRWVMVLSAILAVWGIASAYGRYSRDALLTIAIFLVMSNFTVLFSGLRQSIAISMGFYAFEQVRRRRPVRFIMWVGLAMLFHTSAFMLLFLYPLYHLPITRRSLLWVVPALGAILAFNGQLFALMQMLLRRFTEYEVEAGSTGAYAMLTLFVLFGVFCFVIPEERKLDRDTRGMRNFLLFAIALQMFAPLHSLAMRMNYYYMAFIPLVIPRVIHCRSIRWGRAALLGRYVMVAFFLTYFLVTASRENLLQTYPYHFFWEILE